MSDHDFNFTESGYIAGESFDFNFGAEVNIYSILKGSTNNFIAIWADSDAGLNKGKMYIFSAGAFSIIDLLTKTVSDYYTASHKGKANESLENSDIEDINIT